MTRIVLVSGKGGVGKTTVAAATAVATAQRGHRTIVISFDLAHSLSDSFDLGRGLFETNAGLPVTVAPNLDMQEIDVAEEIERHWGAVRKYIATLFSAAGMSEIVADEVAILPGMEDIVALMTVNDYYRRNAYDAIIVDCPPTGESLRFLNLLASIDWYVRKRFKIDRALVKVARPVANRLTDYQLPEDDYFGALKDIFDRTEGIDALLHDPEVTTVRLVTNAEKMVIRETQRAYTYFSMYGMTADQIIVNRLIAAQDGQTQFAKWAETHAAYLSQIQEYFQPVPVHSLPMLEQEVVGLDALRQVARLLFGERDPIERFVLAPPFTFVKLSEEHYRVTMRLPFAEKGAVDLTRSGDDLIIRIGTFKRHVALPRAVARLKHVRAKMNEKELAVDVSGMEAT